MFDVIIAGGGIAGLSAALILGRCRRKVLVCDSGKPRNYASQGIHGFISRDGINPFEMRKIIYDELRSYPSVTCLEGEIIDAEEIQKGYEVRLADGTIYRGKYLLIATGVVDKLPDIKEIEKFYGHNVFHCPYCDGWEMRDQPLAVYGCGTEGYEYAMELTVWSSDIVLCTNGGEMPSSEQSSSLDERGIAVIKEQITSLEGELGGMINIHFDNKQLLPRRALFFNPSQYQASPLAGKLGCEITDGGVVKAGKFQQTKSRLFVAGNAARSLQLAIVAAAEGAEAAFALNTALHKEDIHDGSDSLA